MKKLFIFFTGIIMSSALYCQDAPKFTLNEASISLNMTNVDNENTENRVGFGAGLYHLYREEKMLNVIIGLEYNYTAQLKKIGSYAHFFYEENVTYHINNLSVPIGLRFNIGKKTKYFIETGFFGDFTLYSNENGTAHSSGFGSDSIYYSNVKQFDQKAGLGESFGVGLGAGARIPVAKFDLLIKADYKYGLNTINYNPEMYLRYFRLMFGLGFD